MMSFICGTAEVGAARMEGSRGDIARLDGEKAIQALECGARFCEPMSVKVAGAEFVGALCCTGKL